MFKICGCVVLPVPLLAMLEVAEWLAVGADIVRVGVNVP